MPIMWEVQIRMLYRRALAMQCHARDAHIALPVRQGRPECRVGGCEIGDRSLPAAVTGHASTASRSYEASAALVFRMATGAGLPGQIGRRMYGRIGMLMHLTMALLARRIGYGRERRGMAGRTIADKAIMCCGSGSRQP